MAKKEDFDVVIIGSGVSGLVCGCYLQKAGLKVAILEGREEAGGGRMAAEMMRPGYLVQSCVFGDMEPIMMHQLNLELDRYGYQEIEMINDWGWSHLFKEGTCLLNHPYDIQKFVQKLRRFSEKDAKKVLEIAEYMAGPYDAKTPRGVKFAELLLAEAWTWENFERLIDLVAPLLPFDDPYEVTDINGFEMVDLMFESDALKVFCLGFAIGGASYPFYTGGSGSIGALFWPLGILYSHPKHSCHSLAHVYIRCFRALGGKLFNSCPVKKVIIAGGEAKGVVLDDHAAFPGKEITAKRVVTNLNPRLTFTELVGEEHVGKRVIQKLKTNWKGDAVLLTIDYAMKERPHAAAEKFDPDLVHSMAGMMGAETVRDVIHEHGERMAGRIPDKPMVSFALPHKDDPTQTQPGINCMAHMCIEAPYSIYDKGGPQAWDDKDLRRQVAENIFNTWEAYFPGFRENVLDYWMTTPLDLERLNPNYLRGCMCGGSPSAHNMFYANRANIEGFEKGGIITPIKNLYGSGSVGWASSAGSNGYLAASHIAEELGIRNQPWWTHRVYEYLRKKCIEKSYVPLKPTSILDK
jgi:beta-carotene ketolase (CrtO type)